MCVNNDTYLKQKKQEQLAEDLMRQEREFYEPSITLMVCIIGAGLIALIMALLGGA